MEQEKAAHTRRKDVAMEDDYRVKAHTLVYRAESWRKANPEAWGHMVEMALDEAAHKRHFSSQWLIEETRKYDYVDRAGEPFNVNNSFAPAFARMIAKEYPETAEYIELRKSLLDGVI